LLQSISIAALTTVDAVEQVIDHGTSIAPPGGLPSRRDVDPLALASVLPSVFLVDIDRTGTATWRLVGEALRPFLEGAPIGRVVGATGPAGFRSLMTSAIRAIRRDRCPLALDGMASAGLRSDKLIRFDLALVPLADDAEHIDAALGALVWRPVVSFTR
jgi:hypothetical protein